jgi:hypothetical protein
MTIHYVISQSDILKWHTVHSCRTSQYIYMHIKISIEDKEYVYENFVIIRFRKV